MNRIESKIHCTHAHKKGKSKKKKRKRKTDVCVCIYLSLSFGRTRVQTVCCGNTKKSALIFWRERERERERELTSNEKEKKREFFKIIKKNPKHIGMEFRVCVVCLCFCCVENECVISCTYKTQHKRLCTTRARDDTRNNVSQQTQKSGERKRGRRVLFLFVLVE